MEIERKYLVRAKPDLSSAKCARIEQYYICLSEKEEVRIRKKGNKCFITVKNNGTLVRDEREVEIPQNVYDALLPAAGNRTVIKDRYEINLSDGNTAELDIYRGDLEGLNHLTVEVEFKNEELAGAFRGPSWFGREVTSDARYKNKNLATSGWPKEE